MRSMIAVGLVVVVAACSTDDSTMVEDPAACEIESLPFAGSPDAPTIVDVGLEVQISGIVPVATVTDPQGDDNIRDVLQSFGVYPDVRCEGVPITLQDDFVGVGIEETFGTAVPASDAALYQAISSATAVWPVRVDFSDLDGNHTVGDLLARLIR